MRKGRKGQGILEYVVVLTAIVGVIIVAAVTIGDRTEVTYENAGQVIDNANNMLATAGAAP